MLRFASEPSECATFSRLCGMVRVCLILRFVPQPHFHYAIYMAHLRQSSNNLEKSWQNGERFEVFERLVI